MSSSNGDKVSQLLKALKDEYDASKDKGKDDK